MRMQDEPAVTTTAVPSGAPGFGPGDDNAAGEGGSSAAVVGGGRGAEARDDDAPVAPGPAHVEAWARVRGRLREEVGEVEYRTWMRQMALAAIEGDEAVVHVPSRFLRDWLRGQFGDRMRALWAAEGVGVRRVEIRVAPAGSAVGGDPAPAPGRGGEDEAEAARAAPVPAPSAAAPLDRKSVV